MSLLKKIGVATTLAVVTALYSPRIQADDLGRDLDIKISVEDFKPLVTQPVSYPYIDEKVVSDIALGLTNIVSNPGIGEVVLQTVKETSRYLERRKATDKLIKEGFETDTTSWRYEVTERPIFSHRLKQRAFSIYQNLKSQE